MRLATVVALVKTARAEGFGRHPGFLIIDSPGSEEMNSERVGDFLAELASLAEETEGVQVIVAMQGPEKVMDVVSATRVRGCGAGEFPLVRAGARCTIGH